MSSDLQQQKSYFCHQCDGRVPVVLGVEEVSCGVCGGPFVEEVAPFVRSTIAVNPAAALRGSGGSTIHIARNPAFFLPDGRPRQQPAPGSNAADGVAVETSSQSSAPPAAAGAADGAALASIGGGASDTNELSEGPAGAPVARSSSGGNGGAASNPPPITGSVPSSFIASRPSGSSSSAAAGQGYYDYDLSGDDEEEDEDDDDDYLELDGAYGGYRAAGARYAVSGAAAAAGILASSIRYRPAGGGGSSSGFAGSRSPPGAGSFGRPSYASASAAAAETHYLSALRLALQSMIEAEDSDDDESAPGGDSGSGSGSGSGSSSSQAAASSSGSGSGSGNRSHARRMEALNALMLLTQLSNHRQAASAGGIESSTHGHGSSITMGDYAFGDISALAARLEAADSASGRSTAGLTSRPAAPEALAALPLVPADGDVVPSGDCPVCQESLKRATQGNGGNISKNNDSNSMSNGASENGTSSLSSSPSSSSSSNSSSAVISSDSANDSGSGAAATAYEAAAPASSTTSRAAAVTVAGAEEEEEEEAEVSMVVSLPCAHSYHYACVAPWWEQSNTCPTCRYELPTEDGEYNAKKGLSLQALLGASGS